MLGLGALLVLSAVSVFAFVAWSLIGVWGQVAVLTTAVVMCVVGARVARARGLGAAATTGEVLSVGISALMAAGARALDFLGTAAVPVWTYTTFACLALAALWTLFARLVEGTPGTTETDAEVPGAAGDGSVPAQRPGLLMWAAAGAGSVATFTAVAALFAEVAAVGPVAAALVWWSAAAVSTTAAAVLNQGGRVRRCAFVPAAAAAAQVCVGVVLLLEAGWSVQTAPVLRWQVAAALLLPVLPLVWVAVRRVGAETTRSGAALVWACFAAASLPVSVVLMEAPLWVWGGLSLITSAGSVAVIAASRRGSAAGRTSSSQRSSRVRRVFGEAAALLLAASAPVLALVVSFLVFAEVPSLAAVSESAREAAGSVWAVLVWAVWAASCAGAAALSWVPTSQRLAGVAICDPGVVESPRLVEQAHAWCAGVSAGVVMSLVSVAQFSDRKDLVALPIGVGVAVVLVALAVGRWSRGRVIVAAQVQGAAAQVSLARAWQVVESCALFVGAWGAVVIAQVLMSGWSGFAVAGVLLLLAAALGVYASAPGRFGFAYGASALVALANAVAVADTGSGTVVECFTLPAAASLAVVGFLQARSGRRAVQSSGGRPLASMISWGPALSVALLPSLWVALGQEFGPRLVVVFVAALAVLAVGLVRSLKAPVVFGGVVLVVVAVNQAGPYVAFVPSWVLLAAGGVALLAAGVAWERAVGTGRAAARWLSELR